MLNVGFAESEGVPGTDRGFAYGDGLFETIRMVGRKAVLRRQHVNRMVEDADRLGIIVSRDELDQALSDAAKRYSSGSAPTQSKTQNPQSPQTGWILKMTLTRGSGGRGYRSPESAQPHLYFAASDRPSAPDSEGVVARQASFPLVVNPRLAGIKTLNRLEQVMASREFTGDEWELIMRNVAGDLVEGTRSNLLAHVGDEWVTPPVESVAVAGVMRQYALECLRVHGERVSERPLPNDLTALPGFRGLCLLNSVYGIVTVRRLDEVDLPVDGTLATICDPLETLE